MPNSDGRLEALRTAAALHPLSLATVHVADDVLRACVRDVAEQCIRETCATVPCGDDVRSLLEGAAGTLPSDGRRISASLHKLLSEEAVMTARCAKRSREELAPALAAGSGMDVFGNRPKQASAETIACTNCGMQLSANRFAPHLERCMLGKGRSRRSTLGAPP